MRTNDPATWFRLYAEFATDPKVQMLSEQDQRRYVMLLCMRCSNVNEPFQDDEIAFRLGIGGNEAAETKAEFYRRGLIHGAWFLTKDLITGSDADRPPAHEWRLIRERVFERDDYTCQYCGERGKRLECDHIIPVARGGKHGDDNLVTACFACNRSKRDKLVSEWSAGNV